MQYFGRKSPKAAKIKETIGKKSDDIPEAENNKKNKGATNSSPLLGDASYPGCQKTPSTAPGPSVVESGGPWGSMKERKTRKVLERWPLELANSPNGPNQRKFLKRLKGATPGKVKDEVQGQKKMQDFLRKWRKETEEEVEGNKNPP